VAAYRDLQLVGAAAAAPLSEAPEQREDTDAAGAGCYVTSF
jgi:hypothetical protein